MTFEQDDPGSVLYALADDVPSRISLDSELEKRLMAQAITQRQKAKRKPLIVAVICAFAAVGGTTVLAAGGMDTIREWFATAEMVYPDGSRSELEITPEGRIFLDETRSYKIVPEEGETMEKFRGKKVTFYPARRAGVANERTDGRQVDK